MDIQSCLLQPPMLSYLSIDTNMGSFLALRCPSVKVLTLSIAVSPGAKFSSPRSLHLKNEEWGSVQTLHVYPHHKQFCFLSMRIQLSHFYHLRLKDHRSTASICHSLVLRPEDLLVLQELSFGVSEWDIFFIMLEQRLLARPKGGIKHRENRD